jgi:hypothetical protein
MPPSKQVLFTYKRILGDATMTVAEEISNAQVLITVKTYPLPSSTYGELVCTAGLLAGEKWIRIYPIPFRFLQDEHRYPKYGWVELDLIKNTKDFRPESYRPRLGVDETIRVNNKLGTHNAWAARRSYALKEVFTSMGDVIALAKGPTKKSLATLKPKQIVDFVIEDDEREWKQDWLDKLKQMHLFEPVRSGEAQGKVIRKLPYKFSYRFLSDGDKEPRQMMIEDWEIGALFWNCLARTDGDEVAAKRLVRKKYLEDFAANKDLHLFVGTTLRFHNVAPNPFVIIGVFYPPKSAQLSML